MSRWRAASIHLALSLLFIAAIVYVECRLWYPPPLLSATGSDRMLLLVVVGNLALGPLLTLIAFKTGKSTLRSDLIVIATLQILASGVGTMAMFDNRPVFLVGAIDRLNLVTAAELAASDLAEADPAYATLGWGAPHRVGAAVPTDPKEKTALLQRTVDDGTDIQVLPMYYVSYDSQRESLLAHCRPIADLRKIDTGGHAVDKALAGQVDDSVCWIPLVHRKAFLTQLISRKDATPVGVVDIDPWQK